MAGATKVIAVVGGTGAQGGGLVQAILADAGGGFAARVVTRKTASAKAIALGKLGAEVVEADTDDVESVKRAFRGAHGAFCITNFWEHGKPEKELSQAANMAAAAKAEGVAHVIWSTLEDSRAFIPLSDARMPTLMGKYKVPHFDAKGEADRAFADLGVPTTYLLTSFYWENLIHFGMGPKRGADRGLSFSLPIGEKKFPQIAVADIGKCAFGIFKKGRDLVGKRVGVAGEHLTGREMAAALEKALGEPVRYDPITPEAYRKLGFPGSDDLGNMFQFNADFADAFCGARDLAGARALNPELQTFAQWLERNKGMIPLE
jgi:uncharacterized protein YbjT (DUF2867 family)